MTLNRQKGNMYGFVTHTWNAIKGRCPHDCEYCYMKVFPQRELRLDENEFKTDLGKNNFIFVGSSCDMFAESIPSAWITRIMEYLHRFDNTYLFQTKNPKRFREFRDYFPISSILGTTIETNREGFNYNAPKISERIKGMEDMRYEGFRTMITIEPIIDFDVTPMADLIIRADPEFVNIGADSKKHNLPEPSGFKIACLIKELEKFTKVKCKENLDRLTKLDISNV